jgi:hypothetical protein
MHGRGCGSRDALRGCPRLGYDNPRDVGTTDNLGPLCSGVFYRIHWTFNLRVCVGRGPCVLDLWLSLELARVAGRDELQQR